MPNLGDRFVEHGVIGGETGQFRLGHFFWCKAPCRHDLGQLGSKMTSGFLKMPADRWWTYADLSRHITTGSAVKNPHAIDLKRQKVASRFGLTNGRSNLGLEDTAFVLLIHGTTETTHPVFFQMHRPLASAAFECHPSIHFVTEGVLGDCQEPRAEPHTAGGVESLDRLTERRESFLTEVTHRFHAEASVAPLHELTTKHGAEDLPQLEPRRLIAIAEPAYERCRHVVHRWDPLTLIRSVRCPVSLTIATSVEQTG